MDNKKERIVLSAIEMFREKGIEKTKISDIVKGAGIAQGTFYLYFSSKLAVMPSIAEVMVERMLDSIKEETENAKDINKLMRSIVEAVFRLTEADRDIFALMYAGLAATEYMTEWESIYADYYKWMAQQLEVAKEAGAIDVSLDSEETAILLIGLIESAAEQTFLYSPKGQGKAEEKKEQVVQFALGALGCRNTSNI
ncbi:TetR family transcriptional regulator [Aciduricibacillus chroicocephali]|uniref:TetR family transcriptional regulator n=1 Tax=Aciduricibacillus chroicocephali TaxID=3054939 RepID=A0ABY9KU88_9BACI|nr:TetR family transcriptional regulator [Bacillaceae bacterium 44XB]